MRAKFFSVEDNSIYNEGYPCIQEIRSGVEPIVECKRCGGLIITATGNIKVALAPRKGTKWPDIFANGDAGPQFIVSARVLDAWHTEGIGEYPHHQVEILAPLPITLKDTNPPKYYWLEGKKILGARMDFEASGFVGVKFCSECGRRMADIGATYDRQHSKPWSFVFVAGSWNGANLFTTDLSHEHFFCTEAVLECARKYKLTNFRFIPIEEGDANQSSGIEYL